MVFNAALGRRAGPQPRLRQDHHRHQPRAREVPHPGDVVEHHVPHRGRRPAARPGPRREGPGADGQHQPGRHPQPGLQAAQGQPQARQPVAAAEAAQLRQDLHRLLPRPARRGALEVLPVLQDRQGEERRHAGLGEPHRRGRGQPVERPLHLGRQQADLQLRGPRLPPDVAGHPGRRPVRDGRHRQGPAGLHPADRPRRPHRGPDPGAAQPGRLPGRHAHPSTDGRSSGPPRT